MARAVIALAFVLGALSSSIARAQTDEQASADHKVAEGISQAAVTVYAGGHYQDAIDLFVEANRLRPSAALSFNIARCYEQLHDPRHAIEWYRDYLERSDNPPDVVSVKARIGHLERRLARRRGQMRAPAPAPAPAPRRDRDVPVDEPLVRPLSSELRLPAMHAGST